MSGILDLDADTELDRTGAIHQAMGFASVCWTERPTGVFDSTKCHEAALELERFLFPGQGIDAPDTVAMPYVEVEEHAPRGYEPLRSFDLDIPSHAAAQRLLDGGVVHGYEFRDDHPANPQAMPVEPRVAQTTIDEEPEFWHGLTMWGGGYDVSSKKEIGSAFQVRAGGHMAVSIDGHDFEIDRLQVLRLRDLLNVATARGAL